MTLRVKLVLALLGLSVLATAGLGLWTYSATADRLRREIDSSLVAAANPIVSRLGGMSIAEVDGDADADDTDVDGDGRTGPFERPRSFDQILLQVITADGTPVYRSRAAELPVGIDDVDVATAEVADEVVREVRLEDEPYRMLTVPVPGGAVQVARSLAETDRLLDSIRDRTLVAVCLVAAASSIAGLLIARRATQRLVRLTGFAEEIATTGRFDADVPVNGRDEVGRLGAAFSEMLAAVTKSREDQQRLVQDAGHELRTPLTSLRTNISVLRRYDQLAPETRAQVIVDLEGEARELTALVNELVELATDRRSEEPEQPVRLDAIIERVAERVRRRTGRIIEVRADDTIVRGRPHALDRAIGNLIENAAKFDPSGAPILVTSAEGRVRVDDRGPGIDPVDLPHVFDRFYRATAARSAAGSGLGLAIVRDIVEQHGGRATADNRPGGGASVGFDLSSAVTTEPIPT